MNSGEILFSKNALEQYRHETNTVERLNSLYSNGESCRTLAAAMDQENCDVSDEESSMSIPIDNPPSGSIVYQLFQYFEKDYISKIVPRYEEIERSIRERCNLTALVADIGKQRKNIVLIMETLVRIMILEVLCLDDKGGKIRQITNRFKEFYLLDITNGGRPLKGCKSNLSNTEKVNALIISSNKISADKKRDLFYIEQSGTRQRGRIPLSKNGKKPDIVSALKSEFILSSKTIPPVYYDEKKKKFFIDVLRSSKSVEDTLAIVNSDNNIQYPVDYYSVFLKIQDIFSAAIATVENHGWYLTRIKQALHRLTPQQWPMKGLVRSILNAESIFAIRELVIPKSTESYYCAYSGERLYEGDKVWHIRILLNDGGRYQKWEKDGKRPASPNTAPEFKKSMKAYFIKQYITSQCSIFYTEMDPEYKKLCLTKSTPNSSITIPSPLPLQNNLSKIPPYYLPYNRQMSVNTLWYSLMQLRASITKHQLDNFTYLLNSIGGRNGVKYSQLMSDYIKTIQIMSHNNNHNNTHGIDDGTMQIRVMIYCSTIPWCISTPITNLEESTFVDMMFDILLDFIDLLFPYTEFDRPEPLPIPIEKREIIFPKLGLPLKNTKNTIANVNIKPRLSNTLILSNLLILSDKRRENDQEYGKMNESVKLERLEMYIMKFPCLFLSYFYSIYHFQFDGTQPPLTLPETFNLMQKFNLFVDTKISQ